MKTYLHQAIRNAGSLPPLLLVSCRVLAPQVAASRVALQVADDDGLRGARHWDLFPAPSAVINKDLDPVAHGLGAAEPAGLAAVHGVPELVRSPAALDCCELSEDS